MKISLKLSSKKNSQFVKISKKYFKLMTPEECLVNMKNSLGRIDMSQCRMNPLPEANHDPKNTRFKLFGLPESKLNRNQPIIVEHILKYVPDLIFVQMDPMNYISRQRFLSHKCALNNLEDYEIKGIENLSDPRPTSWEECIIDPLILDMSNANQVHTKLDYTKGFVTYSSPNLQERAVHDNLTEKFVKSITDYVIANKWSPYFEINSLVFSGVMGKQKILMGDMPEILLRQILGNTIYIQEVRDIFKTVLLRIKESDGEYDMETATKLFFSHIFLTPRDIYMSALLKNVLKACYSVLAYVGHPHFLPIQKYWIPPPNGVNFTTACTIPKRIMNETDEDLIEKQAIFDVLLNSRVWSDIYVTNPFPYIEHDATKIPKEDLDTFKKTFYINLKKYQAFRDKILEGCKKKKIDNGAYKKIYKLTDN